MRSLLAVILLAGCGDVAKAPDAKPPMCGDHALDTGEECDDGGESAGCNDDCTIARCGDMKINVTANEQCEDGDTDNGNTCSNACRVNTPFPSTGSEGAFAPTSSMRLAGGIHNYTTINIPDGVVITTDTGVLEMRATGAVTINGIVDLSGGRGGDSVLGDSNGAGSSGGDTGNPTPGATPVMPACISAAAGGGVGTPGVTGGSVVGPCVAFGGSMGGGTGGARCNGGGGGGGFAGGGGGAGYTSTTPANGGAGASAQGGSGGAGGASTNDVNGIGKTPGLGGLGLGRYAGTDGVFAQTQCGGSYPGTPGGGGATHPFASSDLGVTTTFQPGSGGGAGGTGCGGFYYGGAGGGGGGGAVRISSSVSITIGSTGKVLADGGAGGNGNVAAPGSGPGGGGSGGVIYLATPTLDVQSGSKVSAVGGAGGTGSPAACGRGGNGGLGRIRISATSSTCKLDGLFTPALAAVGCAPSMVTEKVYVALYPN